MNARRQHSPAGLSEEKKTQGREEDWRKMDAPGLRAARIADHRQPGRSGGLGDMSGTAAFGGSTQITAQILWGVATPRVMDARKGGTCRTP